MSFELDYFMWTNWTIGFEIKKYSTYGITFYFGPIIITIWFDFLEKKP